MYYISGITLQTEFTINCIGWLDDDESLVSNRLSYKLYRKGETTFDATSPNGIFQSLILQTGDQNNNDILQLQVWVTDEYGDGAVADINVQV